VACLRDITTALGITERSVVGIVTGLTAAGCVVNDKEAPGRGHRTHGHATGQSGQQHEYEVPSHLWPKVAPNRYHVRRMTPGRPGWRGSRVVPGTPPR
jgi:hypothetical protein